MDFGILKRQAREQIKGNIGILFLTLLIISFITVVGTFILNFVPAGSLVARIVITPAFSLGLVKIYLNLSHGKTPKVSDAVCGFRDFWAAFKVRFITDFYTFLWSLLFIVPGVIKSISYSMSMYVLAENEGESAIECIDESIAITDGHKMELFLLTLSFFGWFLLGILTAGILLLVWVIPYYQATMANAYESLKRKPVMWTPLPEDEAAASKE